MAPLQRSSRTILQVEDVAKRFGRGRARMTALQPLTRTFENTERWGVIGESGSGKSTLARILVGLEQPSSGAVYWNGRNLSGLAHSEIREFRRQVQYIAQDTSSSFDPRRSLLDSLVQPTRRLAGLNQADAEARAFDVLATLGLDERAATGRPVDVSGGQRQRYAIARALVVRPSLLICDEVVSALDVSVQGSILNLLMDYCRDNNAGIIFVSHGIPATAFAAERLIVMRRGYVVEDGTTRQLVDSPEHRYTRTLMAATR